jgi:hypothetical protein
VYATPPPNCHIRPINTYTILKVACEKKVLERPAIMELLKRFEEKDNTKLDMDKIC